MQRPIRSYPYHNVRALYPGIMATPPGLTKDGYEVQFGTNHMGHALMLKYLLPIMAKTAAAGRDVRLITTSSSAFQAASGISYDTMKTPQPAFFGHFRRYMQSKLANLLYAQKIAELYPNIVFCAIQPGAVATDIFGQNPSLLDKSFTYIGAGGKYLNPEEDSYNMLLVATTPRQNVKSGTYYEPVGWPGKLNKASEDQTLRDQLWTWTQKELEGYKI
jgi:NAD(P)-dependent dehydrogenase (short-subunit alcohol dehydrogenase family)